MFKENFFQRYTLFYKSDLRFFFLGVSGIPGQMGPQGLPGIPGLDGCNGTDVSTIYLFTSIILNHQNNYSIIFKKLTG